MLSDMHSGPWSRELVLHFRYGDNGSKLYYYYGEAFLIYHHQKWLQIAPGIRAAWRRIDRKRRKWTPEIDPLLDVTITLKKKGFTLENRSRFQGQIFLAGHLHPLFFYRDRVRFEYESFMGRHRFKPYVADEIIYSPGLGIVENRLAFGNHIILAKNLELAVYYLLRSLRRIHHENILGLHVNWKL